MNLAGLSRLAETIFDAVTGNGVVASISRRRSRNHLRILAYHGVDDEEGFRSQMEHLCRFYEPVSADQVLDSLSRIHLGVERCLLWRYGSRFDDGHPSVVDTRAADYGATRDPDHSLCLPGRHRYQRSVLVASNREGVRHRF